MPISVKVYNQEAETVKELKLDKGIFSVAPNDALVHQAFVCQASNQRQVLAHTKDRSDVRGGGRKPWRQKGTGRARAGSNRSPIWRSGGVTFGPSKDRNFKKNLNKKMKQKAMLMVLSDKLISKRMLVLDKIGLNEYKTKKFLEIIVGLESKWEKEKDNKTKTKRSLLVIDSFQKDNKAKKSGQNIVGLKTINSENINILDLLKYQKLIITESAVKDLEKKYK